MSAQKASADADASNTTTTTITHTHTYTAKKKKQLQMYIHGRVCLCRHAAHGQPHCAIIFLLLSLSCERAPVFVAFGVGVGQK